MKYGDKSCVHNSSLVRTRRTFLGVHYLFSERVIKCVVVDHAHTSLSSVFYI